MRDFRHGGELTENTMRGDGNEDIMKLEAILFSALLSTASFLTFAQNPADVNITVHHTSAASGKQMFEAYCASCHGMGGKGGGPVASALKVPPADLTVLSRTVTFPG